MGETIRAARLITAATPKQPDVRPRQVGENRPAPPTAREIVALANSPLRAQPEPLSTETSIQRIRDREAIEDLWGWNGYRSAVAHFVRPDLREAIETLEAVEALIGQGCNRGRRCPKDFEPDEDPDEAKAPECDKGRADIELGELTIAVLAGLSAVVHSLTTTAEDLTLAVTTSWRPAPDTQRKRA